MITRKQRQRAGKVVRKDEHGKVREQTRDFGDGFQGNVKTMWESS